MKKQIVIATWIVLLTGCAGMMQGMVRNSGERVAILYQQAMEHDELQVTLPSGEKFTGKAVMVGHSSGVGYGFGTAMATGSSGYAYGTGSAFSVVETYTGNMRAVLFGDQGHTMRCSLQYADSSGFTSAGGVGVCETSDGKIIDVQW